MAGRPAYKPTDQERKQVEALAGYGIPHLGIADLLGITRKTVEKHFRRELTAGSTKATAKVAEILYRQILDGNTSAAMFWLKCRAGWSEKSLHEVTGKDGKDLSPQVIIIKGKSPGEQ